VRVIVRLRDRLVSQWANYREIDATVLRSHVGPHPDRFGESNTWQNPGYY